jgi:hypothetical protein
VLPVKKSNGREYAVQKEQAEKAKKQVQEYIMGLH